jgi:uncharacterized protein YigA (DUF484 family)
MTEQEVARFLEQNPDFFERNPALIAGLALPDPHGGKALSLTERQTQLLRERVKSLELRVAELVRHGQDNDLIADRLVEWTRLMLAQRDRARVTEIAVSELKRVFALPLAALRIWAPDPELIGLPCAGAVGEDVIRLASSMRAPYCGANADFEPAVWMLDDSGVPAASLAMIPLRVGDETQAFGLLVLGSPDPARFVAGMGTAFLSRLGELASAALAPTPAA